MLKKTVQAFQWIGKHWAIFTTLLLVVAIVITTAVCWHLFGGEEKDYVPIYLTVTGMGEGKDMTERKLMVKEDATVAEIFSLDYPEIYEEFGKPLVMNNVFYSFLGVRSTAKKNFYLKIDGTYENIVTQAYIRDGALVEIEYR